MQLNDSTLKIYRRLRQRARLLALKLNSRPLANLYLAGQVQALLRNVKEEPIEEHAMLVADQIFLAMEDYWAPGVSPAEIRVRLLHDLGFDFWENLTLQSPMVDYALAALAQLEKLELTNGEILEVGAGVGNLSRRLVDFSPRKYVRTDIQPHFLDGRWSKNEMLYDFNFPFHDSAKFDAVVAVNALHCARDKTKSLGFLRHTLKPGGVLLFSEGQPLVAADEPWALNLLFWPFEGWSQNGGFFGPEVWVEHMREAGFEGVESRQLYAGSFSLGAVIWGVAPSSGTNS